MSHILDEKNVLDPEGREVPLGQLWRDRAAVVVFVHHFGCIFCRQQVAEIVPLLDDLRALGGEPSFSRAAFSSLPRAAASAIGSSARKPATTPRQEISSPP
jgi:hypothetical protein